MLKALPACSKAAGKCHFPGPFALKTGDRCSIPGRLVPSRSGWSHRQLPLIQRRMGFAAEGVIVVTLWVSSHTDCTSVAACRVAEITEYLLVAMLGVW
jgi:hypothetical protein